jgi:hypothetical protein
VVVAAPVKEAGALNVVMGVNDHLYDPARASHRHRRLVHHQLPGAGGEGDPRDLGIRHGSITTIHDLTNTQTMVDAPHKDLRRARACGMSLIPTTTGSATAIAEIFPELLGKLNGTRCACRCQRLADRLRVRGGARHHRGRGQRACSAAAEGPLAGILGYEERPLVSIDYRTDPRSAIVDALSTMVVNGTSVKIYAWYDNEWGYANRTVELARLVGGALVSARHPPGTALDARQPPPADPPVPRWSPATTGPSPSPTARCACWWCCTSTARLQPAADRLLFLFYEFFGVVTNLVGGWLGARIGLNRTMNIGLVLQVVALAMLRCRPLADGALGDGGPGAVGHRQGPEQDERQERHQAAGADGAAGRAVPLGGGAHRLEERAQGRRLLPRRPAARGARLPRRGAGDGGGAGAGVAGEPGAAQADLGRRRPSRSSARCSPRAAPSTCSPRRACSCSAPAMCGSWWPAGVPGSSSAGTTGWSAASWRCGSSATASSRRSRRTSPAGAAGPRAGRAHRRLVGRWCWRPCRR